jgi:hypothetical protein
MANNSSQKRYPDELKERAVKMVLELRRDDPGTVERNLCELRTERPLKSAPAHYFLNLEF